ncbi:MAG TPA: hypothetical protein VHQ87_17365 [Rhizobacter sp.]|jgi:hypothetical protein|nr:hypothetical protein [Rhizobacter sp.]
MIERFIAPALTFAVLIAGHVAIASAMFAAPAAQTQQPVAKAPVIQLEAVIVTGKRAS